MTQADFWNRAARKYATSKISNMPAYEQTLDHVRRHLGANDRVVEVGCGTGTTALLLAPSVANYTGTDVSTEMVAIAKEKNAETPVSGLDFKVLDANIAAIEDQSADVILAFNLYHLIPDMDAAFKAASAKLRPGGLFITKSPCLAKKWYLRLLVKPMQIVGKAPFVAFLTPEEYDAAIVRAGFEIIETAYYSERAMNRFVVARKP